MNKTSPPKIVIISGPTAVGKTDVALDLAAPLGVEIISADAMQVYRHMDIGTAKPTPEQQARAAHHLIDVVEPDEPFTAATFTTMADDIIEDLHNKGQPVFVAGGTGLYIKALIHGLFPAPEQDEDFRKSLLAEAEIQGTEVLFRRLEKIDPEAAKRIHSNDTYRIIRALEVHKMTGQPISRLHEMHGFRDRRYRTLWIGLTMDREVLYDRINRRVDMMVDSGLLEEVKGLLKQGYSSSLKSMQSIGYRHMTGFLERAVDWDETLRLLKRDTRHYAKRQLTWFRANPEIEWAVPADVEVLKRKIDQFLN